MTEGKHKLSTIVYETVRGREADHKRSNHNDFATSFELKGRKFSGLRNNSMTGDTEIWIDGEVRKTISEAQRLLNPMACEQAYIELFGLRPKA